MRGTLVLPMVLVSVCCAGMVVESTTSNRDSDGYLHSGYVWPKTILWHGIRSPPGSLWLFYVFLAASVFFYLAVEFINVVSEKVPWVSLMMPGLVKLLDKDMSTAYQVCALGSGLIYLSLGVAKLSDVMEAYLAGMATVQVILSTPRVSGNKLVRLLTMEAFLLSSVFGLAMLDSYHQLNVLNAVYSFYGVLLNVILYYSEHASPTVTWICDTILSVVQMVFTVIAFFLASRVEGTPMLAYSALLACSQALPAL